MNLKALSVSLRTIVVVLAACSWDQLIGDPLTPYWVIISSFRCVPNQAGDFRCSESESTSNGIVSSFASANCADYRNTTPPLEVGGSVSAANCESTYYLVENTYPTPQANSAYNYAISAGGYTSACSPNSYAQSACDSQYTTSIGGCVRSPC